MASINIGNIRLKNNGEGGANKGAARYAEQRKSSANETIVEAWERIFTMKNSDKDMERLREVKRAMEDGDLGREPVPEGKRQGKFNKAEALRLYKVLSVKQREKRLQEMADNVPDNYWLIQDKERLNEFLRILDDEDEIVFDVETTGTDVWKDYIVGHVLTAIKSDQHAYIPTRHKTDMTQLDHKYVTEALRPYYGDEAIGKLAHNAKFDVHMLDRDGVTMRGLTWDTQEAMKILNENEMSFALKNLVTKYLGIQSETYGDLFGQVGFDEVSDLRVALAYAAKDGDVTLKLRDFQRKHLERFPEMLRYFEMVEMAMIPVVVEMEKTGFGIDLDFAEKYRKQLQAETDELKEELLSKLGDINLNSPAQIKPALEQVTGKELESTDAKKVLKPMRNKFPVIDTLLKYKENTKLLSTYIEVLPELIDENTGKLHTSFIPNGTVTGRFSSRNPNLQNIPGEARGLFTAPEGHYIVNADFSSQEVRIIASESKEDVLLDAFARGRDAYATLASKFFGKPYEEVYKNADGSDTEERKQMKVVLLSSMYGASKYGLADSLGISVDEAEKFRVDFFKTYKKIDAFIKESQTFAKKNGFVWIGDKKRKRRLPDSKGGPKVENWQRNRSLRQGPNAKIQGLAAIQTKTTMLELQKLCERKGWRMLFTIHDEVGVLTPDNITGKDISELNEVMTQTFLLDGVENKTDIEVQRKWGESITAEEYVAGKEVPEI